jgi:hypothetical protein
MHWKLVSIHCQHAKPTQAVQDQEQEEAHPGSWCNNAPTGWNWYLVLQHAEEYTEAVTQESCKKTNTTETGKAAWQ